MSRSPPRFDRIGRKFYSKSPADSGRSPIRITATAISTYRGFVNLLSRTKRRVSAKENGAFRWIKSRWNRPLATAKPSPDNEMIPSSLNPPRNIAPALRRLRSHLLEHGVWQRYLLSDAVADPFVCVIPQATLQYCRRAQRSSLASGARLPVRQASLWLREPSPFSPGPKTRRAGVSRHAKASPDRLARCGRFARRQHCKVA